MVQLKRLTTLQSYELHFLKRAPGTNQIALDHKNRHYWRFLECAFEHG